eukprot:315087-Pleurochrysis_carterae.AAC.1
MNEGRLSAAKCSGKKARAVEEGLAGTSALRGTSPSVGFEFARGSPLAIAVDRPKRHGAKEFIPLLAVQAEDFVAHGAVSRWKRGEVRDEHRLQLHIGFKTYAFEKVGKEALVGIVVQPVPDVVQVKMCVQGQGVVEWHPACRVPLERKIPYDPTRPGVELLLADGKRRWAYARFVGRVSDGDQIPQ